MITLNGVDLLIKANALLQEQPWTKETMKLTQVEQKGSTLVFYGTGLLREDKSIDLELLKHLDELSQSLAKTYKLAE